MLEVSRALGRPVRCIIEQPTVRDDLALYFFAYFQLKRRASSFAGTITWSDLVIFHEKIRPGLRFDLLTEMVDLLEPEDDKLSEERRARETKRDGSS